MTLLNELTSAWRMLKARPAFSIGISAMLAVGLGFNVAIYAVVESALLRPLPYADPDRIAFVWRGVWPDGTGRVNSIPEYEDVKARSRSFSAVAAYNISFGPLYEGGFAEQINGSLVTPEFFTVLGRTAALGRTLRPGDEVPVDDRPIVISHGLWSRRFGQDPGIVDRTIAFGGRTRRVVGVMPADFEQPEPFWGETTEYWSPMRITDEMRGLRGNRYLRVIGRLAPGVTPEAAQVEVETIRQAVVAETGGSNDEMPIVLKTVFAQLVGPTQVWLLACAVGAGLVLLLAAGNIVNLLLANTAARRRELAIRTALGASRGRIALQIVGESLWLCLAGGVAGVGFAWLILKTVLASGGDLARLDHAGIDSSVWMFAVGLSVVTGVLCGAWPAWRVTRTQAAANLAGARGSTGVEVSRARTWLIAGEMALAVPLVTAALLLAVTLIQMLRVDTGFDADRALHFRITMPAGEGQRYAEAPARVAFVRDLEARLRATAGVTGAGVVSTLPLGGLNNTGGQFDYDRLDGTRGSLVAGFRSASSGYFDALGIKLTRGRLFTGGAEDSGALVVNEKFAENFWPGADPIGRRVWMGDRTQPPRTIVGVVKDVRHQQLVMPAEAEAFWPYQTDPWATISVVARSENPEGVLSAIRPAVAALDPDIPVVALATVAEIVSGSRESARLSAAASTLFGALATMLSAFGTFAVLSLLVGARTREIGIRLALGSTRGGVRRLLLRDALIPALAGCLAGSVMALWAARAIAASVYGIDARSPWVLVIAAAAMLVAVTMAAWLPARRAVRIDPAITLRADL